MVKNKKVIKGIIVSFALLSVLGVNIKSLATDNSTNNIKTYQVTQKEESEFLNNIYNIETENLKIKEINKEEAKQNKANKEIIETKILEKNDREYINAKFGEIKEFDDNEYKGILNISDIKIETIKNGYYEKIDEKVLDFNNYSDNDLRNIEKEIDIDNKKYYLINVKWEPETTQNIDGDEVPITYKGSKIYQTVVQVPNPDTYKITVTYSGVIEKIDKIYNYSISFEEPNEIPDEVKQEEIKEDKVKPVIIISGIGLVVLLIGAYNYKNTYIYSKLDDGFKLIKKARLSNKNVSIDITNCKNRNKSNIYAIKLNPIAFKNLKGRTISIILGNTKKDVVIWNDYYEIKI